MNDTLNRSLRKLRLSRMRETIDVRVQEAKSGKLNHVEFLELIVQDELEIRSQRLRQRRIKAASFREMRSLDDFDWSFNKSIRRKLIYDLATCRFIDEPRDVLFLGPPGTGKSFLSQALGHEAIKAGYVVLYRSIFDLVRDFLHDEAMAGQEKVLLRYLKPDLLIIDDMGMKRLPKQSGEYLLEVILRRHELRATIMTSNRPLEDWGKLVGDGHPRSVPPPRRGHRDHGPQLPAPRPCGRRPHEEDERSGLQGRVSEIPFTESWPVLKRP